jgi:hypothetical protein
VESQLLNVRECKFSPPGSRHATAAYKGRVVEVSVFQRELCDRSHIVVVIYGRTLGASSQTVEYVTDDAEPARALAAGFDIARATIDGRPL